MLILWKMHAVILIFTIYSFSCRRFAYFFWKYSQVWQFLTLRSQPSVSINIISLSQELLFKFYWWGFKFYFIFFLSSFSHLWTSGKHGSLPKQPILWNWLPEAQKLPSLWEHLGIAETAVLSEEEGDCSIVGSRNSLHLLRGQNGEDGPWQWVAYIGHACPAFMLIVCGYSVQFTQQMALDNTFSLNIWLKKNGFPGKSIFCLLTSEDFSLKNKVR